MLLAGTIRRDGTARISGVEPLVLDGELWLSMMSSSAKSRDLGRDPRVVLNSVITSPSPPAEIKVRGIARAVTGQGRQERYAAAVRDQIGWHPVAGQFALFVIEVADVTYIGSGGVNERRQDPGGPCCGAGRLLCRACPGAFGYACVLACGDRARSVLRHRTAADRNLQQAPPGRHQLGGDTSPRCQA